MSEELPLVTVIIPARNEEADIADCLEAIGKQTYPLERIEVLVVDGASTDETADVARSALGFHAFHRSEVLVNGRVTTPSSLNLGLRLARADVVCRVDARSLIPPNYVETCVELLANPNVSVVGGAQVAQARRDGSMVERGIARALRNPYVMGMSRYRRPGGSGPTDTAYLGAFRTTDLIDVGGWDERFLTNQDFELNRRMATRGVVWCEGDLFVGYRPRRTIRKLAQQYRRFGRWKTAGWLEAGVEVRPRQVALVVAPPIVASVFTWLQRRRSAAGPLCLVVAGLLLDHSSGERAPIGERLVALAASATIAGSWWCGVVEQCARHALGDKALAPAEPT